MKKIINWKLFFVLLVLCLITSVLVIPYQLAITSIEIEVSPFLVVLSALLNSLIIFSVAAFFGLFFSKRIGMGMPILEGILQKENKTKEFKSLLLLSIGLGVFAGILIAALSIPFNRLIPEFQNMEVSAPVWKGFLASFYGGIAEEILLRLFVVSLLVWITFKIKKSKDGNPAIFSIWLSIILAAVLFGIGHLPATAQIVDLTGIVITRAIVLNGIGGIIFGWLYWKKGLESAMIAHFSADIILHVIIPFAVSSFKIFS